MISSLDQLPVSPRRPYIRRPPPPSKMFELFSRLPTELQLKIWRMSMSPERNTSIVSVHWSSEHNSFFSPHKPPVQLSVCHQSRAEALKLYALHFSPSPDLARTCFSCENDILLLDWSSLGAAPGTLNGKMSVHEMKSVKRLMINEEALLLHAKTGMRELRHFEGLTDLAVLCDSKNPQTGMRFGTGDFKIKVEMWSKAEDAAPLQGHKTYVWPDLACLREHDADEECSRHWWMEKWNLRAQREQVVPWTIAMREALLASERPCRFADFRNNPTMVNLIALLMVAPDLDLFGDEEA